MHSGSLPQYIQFLLDPGVHGVQKGQVDFIETHISYLVLTDRFVYKWKKAVEYGFVDFSTLARRKYFCEEELRLNRRLCPDMYRRLVWVSRGPGADWAFNGEGVPVEYGIEMVRLPEERMMTNLIRDNLVDYDQIDAILTVLLPFYEEADNGPQVRENCVCSAVARFVNENFTETERFVGTRELPREVFRTIQEYSNRFLRREKLFADRIYADRVRDCHGDLHSGNICLAESTLVFDCIEFNPEYRYTDIAADLAFLAMDLDYNGLQPLAAYLLNRYVDATGDEGASALFNFYKCYRAYVRGKVTLLATMSPALELAERAQRQETARRYFSLAAEYTLEKAGM